MLKNNNICIEKGGKKEDPVPISNLVDVGIIGGCDMQYNPEMCFQNLDGLGACIGWKMSFWTSHSHF